MIERTFAARLNLLEASLPHQFAGLVHARRIVDLADRLGSHVAHHFAVMPVIGVHRHVAILQNVRHAKHVRANGIDAAPTDAHEPCEEVVAFHHLSQFGRLRERLPKPLYHRRAISSAGWRESI